MNLTLDSLKPFLSPIHFLLCELILCELQEALIVGGTVRDYFFKYPIDDVDFILHKDEEDNITRLLELLGKSKKFKTVELYSPLTIYRTAKIKVETDNYSSVFDVVLPRKELYKFPGAKPEVSAGNYIDDLKRRDFSINTLLIKGEPCGSLEMIDLLNGYEDILNNKLRVLHSLSFLNDPVRVIRGIRFLYRYDLSWEEETEKLSYSSGVLGALENVTIGRKMQEFYKVLLEEKVFSVLDELKNRKMLDLLLPEIETPKLSEDSFKDFLEEKSLNKNTYSLISYLFHKSSKDKIKNLLQFMPVTKKERKIILGNL